MGELIDIFGVSPRLLRGANRMLGHKLTRKVSYSLEAIGSSLLYTILLSVYVAIEVSLLKDLPSTPSSNECPSRQWDFFARI